MSQRPTLPPTQPCDSCPYRRDVASGIWAKIEYEKLPDYDKGTWAQPPHLFMCHQQNGRLCAGWVGVHDMCETMAFRIACANGDIATEDIEPIIDYKTKVPLFGSGLEAALHGLRGIRRPSGEARAMMTKISRKRGGMKWG